MMRSARLRRLGRGLCLAALLPALLAARPLPGAAGRVTALRLAPAAGAAELTVQMEGRPARWADFTLTDPARVVLDIHGARTALPNGAYEGIDRGGIRALRTSQFSDDVVRVVIDLERPTRYRVEESAEGVRVVFASDGRFDAWSSGGARASAARRPERAAAQVPQRRPTRRITVTFQDADIHDVLASFAEFTGRSIVPGSGVTGTVTAEIRDQPWDVAMETILRAYGLAARELDSGIIQVDAIDKLQERETKEPLLTQTFRVNYVPAAELVTTLTPMKSERGSIVANPSTNTLIVTDVESVVNNVSSMVRQLDIRTPQVSIQAKIVFINRTNAEDLGFRYEFRDREGNQLNRLAPGRNPATGEEVPQGTNLILLNGNSIAAAGNANQRITDPALETLITLVTGRYSLFAFIEALQRSQLADVQAAPLITTLDNQEAYILVGERTPIRVVDLGGGATGGGEGGVSIPRATAQLVETGIRLQVTPHITADRRILLQLRAENSSAQPAAGEFGVQFQTQEGSTRRLVNDGETAVIGGLTVTRVDQTRVGIPYLMDIPFVGRLFRRTTKSEQKQDLMILVTPHILEDHS